MSEGWPEWLNAFDEYEVQAETDGRVTEDECKAMVRSLFQERFKLHMHHRIMTRSAYALVVDKEGPKLPNATNVIINETLKQSASERDAPPGWTMPRLANFLATVRDVQRSVFDRTNLSSSYGFKLSYSTSQGDDRPDIFSALREQLGLKLVPIKAPVEIWFVDHVEKPKEND